MNKHKQFIKDAYNGKYGSMCSDWKETILEHYPDFKEEDIKLNRWYVYNNNGKEIIYPNAKDEGGALYGYGTDFKGDWIEYNIDEDNGCHCLCNEIASKDLKRATKEEVETALIAEAKRRGFKKGVYVEFKEVFNKQEKSIKTNGFEFHYNDLDDWLDIGDGEEGVIIYKNGKWSKIITTMTKEEAEKQLNCKIV